MIPRDPILILNLTSSCGHVECKSRWSHGCHCKSSIVLPPFSVHVHKMLRLYQDIPADGLPQKLSCLTFLHESGHQMHKIRAKQVLRWLPMNSVSQRDKAGLV